MTGNLYQDWPVYVLLAGLLSFFIYVIISSHLPEKKNKEDQGKK